jgi:peptidoglycan/xylan/chitin deacetylase (PgdA/CDA1 family)
MIRDLKMTALEALRRAGLFHAVSRSSWRQRRLLVLCYHGISLRDEHLWNGGLYIPLEQFERRMRLLREHDYNVLTLAEGLERVRRGSLPERSVAITFDDGMYDFYAKAWPVIQRYHLPVTVYLTTYHCDYNRPIFRMTCSYLLWRKRDTVFDTGGQWGLNGHADLASPGVRQNVVFALDRYAKAQGMSGRDKDQLTAELADRLHIDYREVLDQRLLHVMNPTEVQDLVRQGVDFQLHTHRHRTPLDRTLFRREIEDNAARLSQLTGGATASHFCYPSGVYDPRFIPWLQELGVESATTCEPGFIHSASNWHLLPRMLDHASVTDIEFESWLTGLRAMLPVRKILIQDPDRVSDPAWSGAPG